MGWVNHVPASVIPTPLSMIDSLVGLVRDDLDKKLRLRFKLPLIHQAIEPDHVQCLQIKCKNFNYSASYISLNSF